MTSVLTLNAEAVDKLLPKISVVTELRKMFASLGEGYAIQPPQTITVFPSNRGDFITYPAAQMEADVFGAKLSPYLTGEEKPVVTAWTLLMSTQTGEPLLLCDSARLTTERTAGTTALAVDYLAGPHARKLAIIGAGSVARAHWNHVRDLRAWDEVCVFSPSVAKDQDRLQEWRKICPGVSVTDSAETAAAGADVVMLCTSSGTPVVETTAIAGHALVTSISTNVAQAHEISPVFLQQAQVFCDYRATTPETAGEMVLATRDCDWQASDVYGDLAELASGNCPEPDFRNQRFFRSVGLGLEDIAMANAIYRAATA